MNQKTVFFAISKSLLITFCLIGCDQKESMNQELKAELSEMFESDQRYRRYLGRVNRDSIFKDSLITAWNTSPEELQNEIWKRQLEIDSINLERVKEIMNKSGYPGSSMVGEPENTAVWYVLQHSPLEVIEEYMPVIKEASEKGELPKHLVGMMEDRVLMYKDEPQIYGTQGKQITLNSGEAKWIIWPITNPQEVNERRKEVGFKTTVEENAQRMGIQYEVISLEELKTMSKY